MTYRLNEAHLARRKKYFPNVTDDEWNDWKWQTKHRIDTTEKLKSYIDLTEEELKTVSSVLNRFRMAITPYYLTLIDPDNPGCPIRLQAIPQSGELVVGKNDLEDPLSEDADAPVQGLTHRYPDRVLFLITDMCSMYCRHCTRRRFAGTKDAEMSKDRIDLAIDYIREHLEMRSWSVTSGSNTFCRNSERSTTSKSFASARVRPSSCRSA